VETWQKKLHDSQRELKDAQVASSSVLKEVQLVQQSRSELASKVEALENKLSVETTKKDYLNSEWKKINIQLSTLQAENARLDERVMNVLEAKASSELMESRLRSQLERETAKNKKLEQILKESKSKPHVTFASTDSSVQEQEPLENEFQAQAQLQQIRLRKSSEMTRLYSAFAEIDLDKSGYIEKHEIPKLLASLKLDVNGKSMDEMMALMDEDGSDSISFPEYVEYISKLNKVVRSDW
jgi:chromosome segregation ATPase